MTGDIRPGRRLPSLRKMAGLFRVSVPTMYAAVQSLAALGFVRIAHGVGIFVTIPRDNTALLNYVWRTASIDELAIVRAAIDERCAPLVAARVAALPPIRLPRTLSDVSFFAHERSMNRLGHPEDFIKADATFHRTVLASLRGIEIGPTLYERIVDRLHPAILGVADLQAADLELDTAHLALARAVTDGDVAAATRLARAMARRELRSLRSTLG